MATRKQREKVTGHTVITMKLQVNHPVIDRNTSKYVRKNFLQVKGRGTMLTLWEVLVVGFINSNFLNQVC